MIDADVNLKVTNKLIVAVKEKAVGSQLVDGEGTRAVVCMLGGRVFYLAPIRKLAHKKLKSLPLQ